MATSSFSFDPPSVPPDRPAAVVGVVRYNATATGDDRFAQLPNVVCEQVQQREGADPGSARFRYTLDDADPSLPWPDGFEDLYPIGSSGRFVVRNDDRLLVYAYIPGGSATLLFDGFAQVPEVQVGSQMQAVTFTAVGVAVRLWDAPLRGAIYQDADDPTATGKSHESELPVRFNPNDDGEARPNAARSAVDVDDSSAQDGTGKHPIFIDSTTPEGRTYSRPWTLAMAVQYLLWRGNFNQFYVKNGDTSGLTTLLQSLRPTSGSTYNPRDPSTYTASDIIVRDFDATNKVGVVAAAELLDSHGFRLQFSTFANGDGSPSTRINIARRDGAFGQAPKKVNLQEQGAVLDPGLTSVRDMHLARDVAGIFNQVRVETDPVRHEISVVLAPGFIPASADAANTNAMKPFLRANWQYDTSQSNRDKYRRYIFDEGADGHWDFATATTKFTAGDLRAVLAADANGGEAPTDGSRKYPTRYRPGGYTLISQSGDKQPMKAQLAVSRDYAGKYPTLWDGTGTWQPVTGGWELLKDRLGIYVTAENPNDWDVGKWTPPGGKVSQVRDGRLKGIEAQTSAAGVQAPTNFTVGHFWLRLTCVIEGDYGIPAVAKQRASSPTNYTVERRIDCRDHYRMELIEPCSVYYDAAGGDGTNPFASRDDTGKAKAYAEAVRAANEFGPTAGSITIPRISRAFNVSDRISGIDGRDVSFKVNAGDTTEGAQYPSVAAITWELGKEQSTTLLLSDMRAQPKEV